MSAASDLTLLLTAAVLSGAAAQAPRRVPSTVVEAPDTRRVAQAQYRVVNRKDATLVTIYGGEKPTGGYSVAIVGVERSSADACTIAWRVQGPPADAMVIQALTYPAITLRLPSSCREIQTSPKLRATASK